MNESKLDALANDEWVGLVIGGHFNIVEELSKYKTSPYLPNKDIKVFKCLDTEGQDQDRE